MNTPILKVDSLVKTYTRGFLSKQERFRLEADFTIHSPGIVGVMGPNGSGKTTLFELITGSNTATSGKIFCAGRDIHRIRYRERDRLAIHYHQSYQVRRFKRAVPAFMLERANSDYPFIHLFDEPQFNTQDGYIGFMIDFFHKLREDGKLVIVCVHPNEQFHLDIMKEICGQFIFVQKNRPVSYAESYDTLIQSEPVRDYLGSLLDQNTE